MAASLARCRSIARVLAHDRAPAAVQKVIHLSTVRSSSLEQIAVDTDVVVISLSASASEQVVSSIAQIAHLRGADLVVVDTSTTSAAQAQAKQTLLSGIGAQFLDAPVSGLPVRAANGDLVAMIGGALPLEDSAALAALNAMCSSLKPVGPEAGHGQLGKALNNVLYNISIAAMAEQLPLAAKMGLDVDAVVESESAGTGASFGWNKWAPEVRLCALTSAVFFA